jgi:hypothetical protein
MFILRNPTDSRASDQGIQHQALQRGPFCSNSAVVAFQQLAGPEAYEVTPSSPTQTATPSLDLSPHETKPHAPDCLELTLATKIKSSRRSTWPNSGTFHAYLYVKTTSTEWAPPPSVARLTPRISLAETRFPVFKQMVWISSLLRMQ